MSPSSSNVLKSRRLYGENDLRYETFELPELKENEILMQVITDSLCASTYKAVKQGTKHKRVPLDIAEKPIIIGYEMCGRIIEIRKAVALSLINRFLYIYQTILRIVAEKVRRFF